MEIKADLIKKIYDLMQDDISREVFYNRLLFEITNDENFIKKMIFTNDSIKGFISRLEREKNKKKIIFGAGKRGRQLYNLFPNVKWYCFVDNYNMGYEVENLSVIGFNEFKAISNNALVCITPKNGYHDIYNQLIEVGVNRNDILNYQTALADFENPYFESFFLHDDNEIFIDAGVYDGNTTIQFREWSNDNYNQVYMFEPSVEYFKRYAGKFNKMKNVEWIKKGLWSKSTNLLLFQRPDSDISVEENLSGLGEDYLYKNGTWTKIPVVSLDEKIGNKKITFLKMDIEGAELEAIRGSKSILSKYKPKLAICVYHKKGDLLNIPNEILNINPNYKFYMRHKSYDTLDTILYGV